MHKIPWSTLLGIGILFILFFIIISTYLTTITYVNTDVAPPDWDYSVHLNNAITYMDFFNKFQFSQIITSYYYYPPAEYLIVGIVSMFIGFSKTTVVFINYLYLCFCLCCISLSLNRTSLDRTSKLLFLLITGSLFTIFTPFWIRKEELMLDYPLTLLLLSSLFLGDFFLLIIKYIINST